MSNKTSARKNDQEKLRYDLVEPSWIMALARPATYGATKYGDNNWKSGGMEVGRVLAAAMRHIELFRMGESHDEESHLLHLEHAMWGIGAALHLSGLMEPEIQANGMNMPPDSMASARHQAKLPEAQGVKID